MTEMKVHNQLMYLGTIDTLHGYQDNPMGGNNGPFNKWF